MAKKLEKAQLGKIVKAAAKTAKKVKPRNSAGGPNEWMRGIEGNKLRTPGSPPTDNMLKKAYAIGRVHGGGKGAIIGSGVGAAAGAAAGYAAGKKQTGGVTRNIEKGTPSYGKNKSSTMKKEEMKPSRIANSKKTTTPSYNPKPANTYLKKGGAVKAKKK